MSLRFYRLTNLTSDNLRLNADINYLFLCCVNMTLIPIIIDAPYLWIRPLGLVPSNLAYRLL